MQKEALKSCENLVYSVFIVYHGTESGLASDILHAGFKGVEGCHCPDEEPVSYFSASIIYAAHRRYAKIWPRTQDGKTRYYQMVLQCRVKPSAVAVKDRQTLGAKGQCDPNYDNKQLEWLVKATRMDPSGNSPQAVAVPHLDNVVRASIAKLGPLSTGSI